MNIAICTNFANEKISSFIQLLLVKNIENVRYF